MYASARKPGIPVRTVYKNRAQRHVLDEHIRTRKGAHGRSEWLCLHGVRIFSTTVQRRGERVEPQEILSAEYWAILTVLDTGAPYAVPVVYGWDGSAAYVLMQPGRKQRALRAQPVACLSVPVTPDARDAQSPPAGLPDAPGGARGALSPRGMGGGGTVLVRGRCEWVDELVGKAHAADVVRRQMAGRRAPSVRDAARLVRADVLKLVPEEIRWVEVAPLF